MQPLPVVPDFDVAEHSAFRLLARLEEGAIAPLCLEGLEEALCYGVVPTIALTAHALDDHLSPPE